MGIQFASEEDRIKYQEELAKGGFEGAKKWLEEAKPERFKWTEEELKILEENNLLDK